jgi:hypothetical protein
MRGPHSTYQAKSFFGKFYSVHFEIGVENIADSELNGSMRPQNSICSQLCE